MLLVLFFSFFLSGAASFLLGRHLHELCWQNLSVTAIWENYLIKAVQRGPARPQPLHKRVLSTRRRKWRVVGAFTWITATRGSINSPDDWLRQTQTQQWSACCCSRCWLTLELCRCRRGSTTSGFWQRYVLRLARPSLGFFSNVSRSRGMRARNAACHHFVAVNRNTSSGSTAFQLVCRADRRRQEPLRPRSGRCSSSSSSRWEALQAGQKRFGRINCGLVWFFTFNLWPVVSCLTVIRQHLWGAQLPPCRTLMLTTETLHHVASPPPLCKGNRKPGREHSGADEGGQVWSPRHRGVQPLPSGPQMAKRQHHVQVHLQEEVEFSPWSGGSSTLICLLIDAGSWTTPQTWRRLMWTEPFATPWTSGLMWPRWPLRSCTAESLTSWLALDQKVWWL